MTRTVKDPEVRKNELVDAAEELFKEKGYSRTSIADIVNKVGVAHGLFYYYFDSKEDIIDAIVQRMVDEFVVSINEIIDDEGLNAKEKFKRLFFSTFNRKKEKIYFFDYYNQEENRLMYSKYMTTISDRVVPLITEIIEQGIEEGVFKTKYPREAVEFWLYGRLSIDISSFPENLDKILRSVRAEAFFLDRILGTKDAFITDMWNELLKDFEKTVQESDVYLKSGDDGNG